MIVDLDAWCIHISTPALISDRTRWSKTAVTSGCADGFISYCSKLLCVTPKSALTAVCHKHLHSYMKINNIADVLGKLYAQILWILCRLPFSLSTKCQPSNFHVLFCNPRILRDTLMGLSDMNSQKVGSKNQWFISIRAIRLLQIFHTDVWHLSQPFRVTAEVWMGIMWRRSGGGWDCFFCLLISSHPFVGLIFWSHHM